MDSLEEDGATILQTHLDAYDELYSLLDGYDYADYSTDDPVQNAEEFGLQICFGKLVTFGHASLILLYLFAAFIYCHTFTKSLRVYLVIKCFWVTVISVSNIILDQMVHAKSAKGVFDGNLFKYRAYFGKVVTCGYFFVCNLNFAFLYDIYSMVCSSMTFSEFLFVKVILVFLFSFLPTASTFRYHTITDKTDSEAFGIEITYRFILFLFICFFIHKVRKAFIESANFRTRGQSEAMAAPAKPSSKHQKVFVFIIIMAIIHLFSMIPRLYIFSLDLKMVEVGQSCTTLTDTCMVSMKRLACASFAKDIIAIIVSFLDILPFFVFLKKEKMKSLICKKE